MYQKMEQKLSLKLNEDVGKLILRVTISVLMLFHGYSKLINGIDSIILSVTSVGLPEFLAYGVYIGEVVFPILIIMGLCTRLSALGMGFTMIIAICLVFSDKLFMLNKFGSPVIELPLLYLLLSVVVFLIGPGKYSLDKKVTD